MPQTRSKHADEVYILQQNLGEHNRSMCYNNIWEQVSVRNKKKYPCYLETKNSSLGISDEFLLAHHQTISLISLSPCDPDPRPPVPFGTRYLGYCV